MQTIWNNYFPIPNGRLTWHLTESRGRKYSAPVTGKCTEPNLVQWCLQNRDLFACRKNTRLKRFSRHTIVVDFIDFMAYKVAFINLHSIFWETHNCYCMSNRHNKTFLWRPVYFRGVFPSIQPRDDTYLSEMFWL